MRRLAVETRFASRSARADGVATSVAHSRRAQQPVSTCKLMTSPSRSMWRRMERVGEGRDLRNRCALNGQELPQANRCLPGRSLTRTRLRGRRHGHLPGRLVRVSRFPRPSSFSANRRVSVTAGARRGSDPNRQGASARSEFQTAFGRWQLPLALSRAGLEFYGLGWHEHCNPDDQYCSHAHRSLPARSVRMSPPLAQGG